MHGMAEVGEGDVRWKSVDAKDICGFWMWICGSIPIPNSYLYTFTWRSVVKKVFKEGIPLAAIFRRSVPDGHRLGMESDCKSVSLIVYRLLYRSTGPEGPC